MANKQIVITHTEPPEGLGPAELGYLLTDDYYDSLSETAGDYHEVMIIATILDLSKRGYINLNSNDGVITSVLGPHIRYSGKPTTGLKNYEQCVMNYLFSESHYQDAIKNTITTNSNQIPNTGYTWLFQFINQFNQLITVYLRNQDFVKAKKPGLFDRSLGWIIFVSYFLTTLFYIFLNRMSYDTVWEWLYDWFTLGAMIAMIAGCVVGLTMSFVGHLYSKPKREDNFSINTSAHNSEASQKLINIWSQILGYRNYLVTVEYERLKEHNYFDNPATAHVEVPQSLPYLIAYHLQGSWAKKVINLELKELYRPVGDQNALQKEIPKMPTSFLESIFGTKQVAKIIFSILITYVFVVVFVFQIYQDL